MLCACFIYFFFVLLILEHTKLSPHIMCKSNCKSEVIRCCLILCIERLFNVFKVFNEICEIVYSSTDSNKTVKALKDFTLTGPFLYFREVIKTSQQRWIHVFFICFFSSLTTQITKKIKDLNIPFLRKTDHLCKLLESLVYF